MSDENPCCGFKKKTVVMSFIGLCCLTLVVWTVMVTAAPPPGTDTGWDDLYSLYSLFNLNACMCDVCMICALMLVW